MADTKISALTASTTPLAGTEVLPIVQSGVTKQVSVANLTAGRAISATQLTLSAGNLIVASGQGIDFSATPGTGTSELLADYEEGTWTPVVSSTSGTITTVGAVSGTYIKVGSQVTVFADINITLLGTGSNALRVAGLPFTPNTSIMASYTPTGVNSTTALSIGGFTTNVMTLRYYDATFPVGSLQGLYVTSTYSV